MAIQKVFETPDVVAQLEKYQLIKQYKKAKDYILAGNTYSVDLKIREPKSQRIYYFRITKKYRAWAILKNNELIVYHIDDHQ